MMKKFINLLAEYRIVNYLVNHPEDRDRKYGKYLTSYRKSIASYIYELGGVIPSKEDVKAKFIHADEADIEGVFKNECHDVKEAVNSVECCHILNIAYERGIDKVLCKYTNAEFNPDGTYKMDLDGKMERSLCLGALTGVKSQDLRLEVESYIKESQSQLSLMGESYGLRFNYPEDLKGVKEPEWLVDGLIYCGDTCMLYGQAKAGKSSAATLLSYCITNGISFLGKSVKKSHVIYVDFELRPFKICEREKQLKDKFIGREDNYFKVMSLSKETWNRQSILSAIKEECSKDPEIGLLVIDPVYMYFDADIKEMEKTKDIMQELRSSVPENVTILFVHHTTKPEKGSDKKKEPTKEEILYSNFGSSAFPNFMDLCMYLKEGTCDNKVWLGCAGRNIRRETIECYYSESTNWCIEPVGAFGGSTFTEDKMKKTISGMSMMDEEAALLTDSTYDEDMFLYEECEYEDESLTDEEKIAWARDLVRDSIQKNNGDERKVREEVKLDLKALRAIGFKINTTTHKISDSEVN